MMEVSWLPPLVLFESYHGHWDTYLEAVYGYFKKDFVDSAPCFRGARLALKKHPLSQGKEATFWHLISEGADEENRLPVIERCERIRWPKPVIEHAEEVVIKAWENERRGKTRICLWLESQEYLVILARRKGYVLLWTAYPVTENHRKAKLQKEYGTYKTANAAP
ncbi:MAG: hypothetical protein KKF02_03350 [Proteobacteria bacterium]|nr:hypothetical protein [Pseudomonadota bacterium]